MFELYHTNINEGYHPVYYLYSSFSAHLSFTGEIILTRYGCIYYSCQ